jgi:hypothetical protein
MTQNSKTSDFTITLDLNSQNMDRKKGRALKLQLGKGKFSIRVFNAQLDNKEESLMRVKAQWIYKEDNE